MKGIFDEFIMLLQEMLHGWDTNIVEGMNKFFIKFCPKDRTYAMTIENKVRLNLAIAIDSIGYEQVYQRLAEKTGLTVCDIQLKMNIQLDQEKTYRREYRKRNSTKIARMRNFYRKIREAKKKLAEENRKGLQYGSGMVGAFQEDHQQSTTGEQEPTRKRKKQYKKSSSSKQTCPHCNLIGHVCPTHGSCLTNPVNMAPKQKTTGEEEQKGMS